MFSMFSQLSGRLAQHPRRKNLRVVALALVFAVGGGALGGCGIVPPVVLTTPGNPVEVSEVFPAALLAEPIRLRAGSVHITQYFPIKSSEERWSVALGFVRTDRGLTTEQRLSGQSNACWTDDPKSMMKSCHQPTPGFRLRWELLRNDEFVIASHELDNQVHRGGGTDAANAITTSLSGFTRLPPGAYRLRVTVLRDAAELDFLQPHILVNRPFFRHVW